MGLFFFIFFTLRYFNLHQFTLHSTSIYLFLYVTLLSLSLIQYTLIYVALVNYFSLGFTKLCIHVIILFCSISSRMVLFSRWALFNFSSFPLDYTTLHYM